MNTPPWVESRAYVTVTALFIGAAAFLHSIANYSFPVPWPDEAVFIWQARAFHAAYSLLAPELNPFRDVMWMPPGYMITLGLFFHIVQPTLAAARDVSFAGVVLMFLVLAIFWSQFRYRLAALSLGGLIFLNKYFIVLGNTARMESLLILGVVVSMYLYAKNHPFKALALLSLLPLIHPNGIYFLLAGSIYFSWQKIGLHEQNRMKRSDTFVVIAALLFWVMYLLYISHHWGDFLHDMGFQFMRKSERDPLVRFLAPVNIGFAVVLAACLFASFRKREKHLILLGLFAGASWLVNQIGQEMWYEVFDAFAFLLLSSLVLLLAGRFRSNAVILIALILLIIANYMLGTIESPANYPHNIHWLSMSTASDVPYLAPGDIGRIEKFLTERKPTDRKLRVKFEPRADALLFPELIDSVVTVVHSAGESPIFPERPYDLYLIHVSRSQPKRWATYPLGWAFEHAGIDPRNDKFILQKRDSTEIWYARFGALQARTENRK